jgi:hypothetical protein
MGTTMTSLSKFWIIGRDIAIMYEGDSGSITSRVSLAAAESAYQRLLRFADELISSKTGRMPHHSAVLQFVYLCPLRIDVPANQLLVFGTTRVSFSSCNRGLEKMWSFDHSLLQAPAPKASAMHPYGNSST